MMATFHWVSNVYILLLVTYLGNSQFFDDYQYDDSGACQPFSFAFDEVPNITIPSVKPAPAPDDAKVPDTPENCSVINPNGNVDNGNSLFIILDPKTLQAVVQVVEPCNRTSADEGSKAPEAGKPPVANIPADASKPPVDGEVPPNVAPKPVPDTGALPVAKIPTDNVADTAKVPDDAADIKPVPPVGADTKAPDATIVAKRAVLPDAGVEPPLGGVPDIGAPKLPLANGVPDVGAPKLPLANGAPNVAVPNLPPAIGVPGATAPKLPPAQGAPVPGGSNPVAGAVDPGKAIPSIAPGGLICDLLTIVQTLVDAILQFLLNLLKQLIDTIVNLLKSIIQAVIGELVPSLLDEILKLLETLLTDVLNDVNGIVNGTLTSLLGSKNSVNGVVTGVTGLLPPITGLDTSSLGTSLTGAISDIIGDVEDLLKDLLGPPPSGLVPELVDNISLVLNNTLEGLLDDVDKLATDALTNLLGNSSVVGDLTTDVTDLLKKLLANKLCNLEVLLTDSKSIPELLQNLLTLIEGLLDDILKGVDKTLIDLLTNVLSDKGLLSDLLKDILKLLEDLITNLLTEKVNQLKSIPPIQDPDQFKATVKQNLTDALTAAVAKSQSPLPTVPGVPVSTPLPTNLLDPVDTLLDGIVKALQDLLTDLENLLTSKANGIVPNILQAIENLLNGLLSGLGAGVAPPLGSKLSNSSNILDPSAILGPLGTIIISILRQVDCNAQCNPLPTPKPPTPPLPPAPTPKPEPNPPVTQPCIPIYYPPTRPCAPIEDSLFDDVNDPDCFSSALNQYQDYINRNIYGSLSDGFGDRLVDSLLECDPCNDPFPLNFEALPNRLIDGLEGTKRLTGNVAYTGLFNLINTLTNNTLSSASSLKSSPATTINL